MAEAVAQETPCSDEHRAAWSRYWQGGSTDFPSALNLLNTKYTPLQHHPPSAQATPFEAMRYDAEVEFFDIRNQKVRQLMRRITEHQYRGGAERVNPIDLSGLSAAEYIAACRLLQETWINLGGGSNPSNVCRGIPAAGEPTEYQRHLSYHGPPETYVAHWEGMGHSEVKSKHRTDIGERAYGRRLYRLGRSVVEGLDYYERDILPKLKGIMAALGGGAQGQRRLANLFIEYAHSHSLAGTLELNDAQRKELFKICFLVMEKEQAQWQVNCFIRRTPWQLGMVVSFARLVILFRDGVVQLDDMFGETGVYRVYSTKGMVDNYDDLRKRCAAIDKKYSEHMGSEVDAREDLVTVYGQVAQ